MKQIFDVIITGGGAAGLMCAIKAGKRGKSVLLIERNKKPGAKILISGGGRCNFTNERVGADSYISGNPHFVKSALARYTPDDFLDMMRAHKLTWHEKTLGQLFCDQGSKAILQMLLDEVEKSGGQLKVCEDVQGVEHRDGFFHITTTSMTVSARALVLASGGLSIPQMGVSDLAYRVARQFGLKVVEPRPGLVPLTFSPELVEEMKSLAGVAVDVKASLPKAAKKSVHSKSPNKAPVFRENLLFTHRGLSGPAILQISSYWRHGEDILISLVPDESNAQAWLREARDAHPNLRLKSFLASKLPNRFADYIAPNDEKLAQNSNAMLDALAEKLGAWRLSPTGSEGFKKAEVTIGGVSTSGLSSQTLEAKTVKGLYFIGECVDVTGWLGGYNFQWAWASGNAAGMAIGNV